ncbi:MAG: ZIP family metal transporter [Burkholderiaceae bacterium]|nr:ZIP family metal transporter [Burkholderiaceae bacterium]
MVAGVLSIVAAAWLSLSVLRHVVPQLVGLSAGMLLGTAILHLLPEAVESGADLHRLAWVLLGGLIGFFALEKSALLRHTHHHEGDGHHHHAGHDRHAAGPGGLLILVGDTIHNFADGVLIAAAFMADPHLGWIATLAIAAHEIPQEIGDFIVLLNAGYSRARAFAYNLISGLAAVVGGILAFYWLAESRQWLPYVMMISAASFIYVALADLIPDMHRHGRGRDALWQLVLMLAGVALIAVLTGSRHAH